MDFYTFPSSSRGFVTSNTRPSFPDQIVTLPNHSACHPPLPSLPYPGQLRLLGFQHPDPYFHPFPLSRPSNIPHTLPAPPRPPAPPASRVLPVPASQTTVRPRSTVSDCNGYKESRDHGDDTIIIVRDRKVRICHGASLYMLCRSWLKNGRSEECQLQCDAAKPCNLEVLPVDVVDTQTPKIVIPQEENNLCEDGEDIKELSAEDLLKRHVNRAKRIRARMSE